MAKERYLVLSDLHLCDVQNHKDGWKSYKASKYLFDEEFAELLDSFVARFEGGDKLVLLLNGDIFDFDLVLGAPEDAPWPITRRERVRGLQATAEKSVWKLERVLADHPIFVEALADFMAKGHDVVYVIGNHDREFHFTEVKKALVDSLRAVAAQKGVSLAESPMKFEPWFYHVPGKIYAEHGQQYDYYTSYGHILCPEVKGKEGPQIVLPMGNLANRYLLSQMGFFNPHASDYILNVFHYIWHWLKHYAFTRRFLVYHWFVGTLLVLWRLISTKRQILRRPPDCSVQLAEAASRSQLSVERVEALGRLGKRPITHRLYRMVREFWLDRLILAAIMTGGTISLALVPIPLWIKLMVPLSSFPLLFLIYEWFAHDESVFSAEGELRAHAKEIAQILDVKLVTFGHTHKPELQPIGRGITWVNTGTWAPVMSRKDDGKLISGLRNYLIAEFDGEGSGGEVELALKSDLPVD
jgi:UDP-2,3-diacylglucosamine pyrophosphatase LpxH